MFPLETKNKTYAYVSTYNFVPLLMAITPRYLDVLNAFRDVKTSAYTRLVVCLSLLPLFVSVFEAISWLLRQLFSSTGSI